MSKTVTVIDTFGFFFRSFYALPQHLSNKDGFPTGLLTGFTNFISTLQKEPTWLGATAPKPLLSTALDFSCGGLAAASTIAGC